MATTPLVYFIDDSATMREVIKIAFRRENLNVVACHDAASALGMMEQNAPDVVISDVIMPDKDGYEVCQYIKQHPKLGRTPVILMSGVVNKSVAEKAFAVKADELIRKPFQPQDLITRVRHLLNPKAAQAPQAPAQMPAAMAAPAAQPVAAPASLSSIFQQPVPNRQMQAPRPMTSGGFAGPAAAAAAVPGTPITGTPTQARVPSPPAQTSNLDLAKMKVEIMRLQSQIKKLESELQAEREYARALEEHIKTLQEAE